MPPARCPSCDTPLTSEEARGPNCPMCGASLQGFQAGPAPYTQPAPYAEPRREWERDAPPDRDHGDYRDYGRSAVEVSPELQKARKETSGVLFAIGILNLICSVVVLVAAPGVLGGPLPPELVAIVIAMTIGVTVVFSGLGWWALYQPLPPAIIGLVVYVLITLLAIASNPKEATNGLYLRILFVALLIRAVVISAKALSPPRRDDRY